MTFDEWWKTKDLEKAQVPNILKNALKELAYEAWCESRYQQKASNELEIGLSLGPWLERPKPPGY